MLVLVHNGAEFFRDNFIISETRFVVIFGQNYILDQYLCSHCNCCWNVFRWSRMTVIIIRKVNEIITKWCLKFTWPVCSPQRY